MDKKLEINKIYLEIPEIVSIVAGPAPGEECYRNCEGSIDDEAMNVLVFPSHVTHIIGSFFTGFFKELRKSMTPGEIMEHFSFDQDMPCKDSAEQAFKKYISSTW